MDASIGEHNIKTFVRILQCGSKFGDELCIHANKDVVRAWEMAVTNSSRSAFFLAKLRPHSNARTGDPGFFTRYRPLGTPKQQRNGVKCMLLVRTVLAALQKASTSQRVHRLDLKIIAPESRGRNGQMSSSGRSGQEEEDEEDDAGLTHRLEVKLVCDHGITKRHSLNLGTADFLRADVDPNSTPSSFTLPAKTLRDWLDHFALSSGPATVGPQSGSRGETQLSWLFSRQEIRIKSWEGWTRELTTEIKVDAGEFAQYWLEGGDVEFTLPMREFRGMLQLAESLSIDVSGAFSMAGQPLTLTSDPENEESESFDIFCAIATTISDAFGTEDGANGGQPPAPQRAESDRPDKRSRSASTANGRDDTERPESRSRQSSAMPASRKPSRLGFSAVPSQTTGGIFRSSLPPQSQQRKEEALFLPSGSQEEEDAAFSAQISASQAALPGQRLTQAEIEQMSGLGDLDQLADDLDLVEAEEEEQLRASQQQDHITHHGYIPGETTTEEDTMGGPVYAGGASMFQPDETLLFNEEQDKGPKSASPDEEEEEMDEDEAMAPTQYAGGPPTFKALFDTD